MPDGVGVAMHLPASVGAPPSLGGVFTHPDKPLWPTTKAMRKHISWVVLSPYSTVAFVELSYVQLMRVFVPLAI